MDDFGRGGGRGGLVGTIHKERDLELDDEGDLILDNEGDLMLDDEGNLKLG